MQLIAIGKLHRGQVAPRNVNLGVAMKLQHHIGLKVRSARLKRGMTQEQLASKLDRSVETISNLERGRYMTGLNTFQEIAAVFDEPMTYFFEGVEKASKSRRRRVEQELELQRLAESASERDLLMMIRLAKAVIDGEAK